jgi:hypothetical protein
MKKTPEPPKGDLLDTDIKLDESADELVVTRKQDVSTILKRNRELQWHPDYDGYTPSRNMQHAASIPMILIEKWKNEEGIDAFNPDHWPRIVRKLNDPAYKYLRTGGGKLKATKAR